MFVDGTAHHVKSGLYFIRCLQKKESMAMVRSILIFFTLTVTFIYAQPSGTSDRTDGLHLTFFGSTTCDECMRIKEQLLTPLIKQHSGKLQVQMYDTDSDSGIQALIAFEKTYHVSNNAAQLLFFPDTFLSGYEDIMRLGRSMIEHRVASAPVAITSPAGPSDSIDLKHALRMKAFSSAFFWGTLVTGLADGVNPCAIATMIFLISFLATRKRRRGEILIIGIAYTATVFVTYLAMGLGLKGVLEQIRGYHIISSIVRWGACTAAMIVALLSFKDAVVYHRSKDAGQITLQLPKSVKIRIHRIISGNLSGSSLLIGSLSYILQFSFRSAASDRYGAGILWTQMERSGKTDAETNGLYKSASRTNHDRTGNLSGGRIGIYRVTGKNWSDTVV